MPYKLRIPRVVGLLPVRNSHGAQPQYPQIAYVLGFTLGRTNISTILIRYITRMFIFNYYEQQS